MFFLQHLNLPVVGTIDLHNLSATVLWVHAGVSVTTAQVISLIRLAKTCEEFSLSVMLSNRSAVKTVAISGGPTASSGVPKLAT